jgi:hypothetical protein
MLDCKQLRLGLAVGAIAVTIGATHRLSGKPWFNLFTKRKGNIGSSSSSISSVLYFVDIQIVIFLVIKIVILLRANPFMSTLSVFVVIPFTYVRGGLTQGGLLYCSGKNSMPLHEECADTIHRLIYYELSGVERTRSSQIPDSKIPNLIFYSTYTLQLTFLLRFQIHRFQTRFSTFSPRTYLNRTVNTKFYATGQLSGKLNRTGRIRGETGRTTV